jgi:phosphoribosylformylglycinamidine synthase
LRQQFSSPAPPPSSRSLQVIGAIDGSGRIKLVDKTAAPDVPTPVDLDLEKVRSGFGDRLCAAAGPGGLWAECSRQGPALVEVPCTGSGRGTQLHPHPLAQVLGKMPDKTFRFSRSDNPLQPLALPEGASPQAALERVLRLPSVGSKRFLTTKVDRCVTGGCARLGPGRCLAAPAVPAPAGAGGCGCLADLPGIPQSHASPGGT